MGAKLISSHIVYKVKCEERDRERLKTRLCPHGNKDTEMRHIRNDSSNARFNIIRLLLNIAIILSFRLGCVDIKAACMQSGPINRELYVRPPRERNIPRGTL